MEPEHHRREMTDGQSGVRGEGTLRTLVLTMVAGALMTACLGMCAFSELERFGPAIGGIIVFKPASSGTERWQISAAVTDGAAVDRMDAATGRNCVLQPAVMASGGGSLVIEAKRLSVPPLYRVHWSGGRTSDGAGDCGKHADLLLSRTDVMRLSNVAGGFGVGARIIGP